MGDKGGSTTIQAPEPVNPFEVSQADFLFNRFNQQTPTSNLQFFSPGQQPTGGQQVSFTNQGLTNQARELFQPNAGNTGRGGKAKGGRGGGGQPPQKGGGVTPNPVTQLPGQFGGGNFRGGFGPAAATAGAGGGGLGFGGSTGFNSPFSLDGSPATAVQSLPPELLAIENAKLTSTANTLSDVLGRQQGLEGNIPDLITGITPQGRTGNLDALGDVRALPQDLDRFREETVNEAFELGAAPLREEFDREFEGLQQTLENRGIPLNSEAGQRTLGEFQERKGESLRRLALSSSLAGGAEASRGIGDISALRGQEFGEAQTTEGFAEQLRGARTGEQLQEANLAQVARTQQINELRSLLGQQQVGAPPIQSFLPTTATGVTDAFGLNAAGQNARANIQGQQAASKKGGLTDLATGLGSAAIFMSDRRLKRNVSIIRRSGGYNWYEYQYLWSDTPYIGVMAQEVMETNPTAVIEHPSGYLMVDYGAL